MMLEKYMDSGEQQVFKPGRVKSARLWVMRMEEREDALELFAASHLYSTLTTGGPHCFFLPTPVSINTLPLED